MALDDDIFKREVLVEKLDKLVEITKFSIIDDIGAFMNMWYYNEFFINKKLVFRVRFAKKEEFNRIRSSSTFLNSVDFKEGEMYLTQDERPILKKHTKPFRTNF